MTTFIMRSNEHIQSVFKWQLKWSCQMTLCDRCKATCQITTFIMLSNGDFHQVVKWKVSQSCQMISVQQLVMTIFQKCQLKRRQIRRMLILEFSALMNIIRISNVHQNMNCYSNTCMQLHICDSAFTVQLNYISMYYYN